MYREHRHGRDKVPPGELVILQLKLISVQIWPRSLIFLHVYGGIRSPGKNNQV